MEIDPQRCSGKCYDPQGFGHHYPCSKHGTVQENGNWWCKTHAPSRVKARQKKRDQEMYAQWAVDDAKQKRKTEQQQAMDDMMRVGKRIAEMGELRSSDYDVIRDCVAAYEANGGRIK
jgi:hypothetical protein